MSTGRKRRVIEGNTVRKLQVREERHYRRQEESHAYRVERDQKIQYTTVIYMMFLTIAAAMVLWSCVTYLQLQAETTSRVKNIAALETELEDLKKENDDNYTRIMTSVDLDYIRDVAINELGMVYANEDQVILYDGGTKDYVRQSQDVPKDSKNSLMDQLLGKKRKVGVIYVKTSQAAVQETAWHSEDETKTGTFVCCDRTASYGNHCTTGLYQQSQRRAV